MPPSFPFFLLFPPSLRCFSSSHFFTFHIPNFPPSSSRLLPLFSPVPRRPFPTFPSLSPSHLPLLRSHLPSPSSTFPFSPLLSYWPFPLSLFLSLLPISPSFSLHLSFLFSPPVLAISPLSIYSFSLLCSVLLLTFFSFLPFTSSLLLSLHAYPFPSLSFSPFPPSSRATYPPSSSPLLTSSPLPPFLFSLISPFSSSSLLCNFRSFLSSSRLSTFPLLLIFRSFIPGSSLLYHTCLSCLIFAPPLSPSLPSSLPLLISFPRSSLPFPPHFLLLSPSPLSPSHLSPFSLPPLSSYLPLFPSLPSHFPPLMPSLFPSLPFYTSPPLIVLPLFPSLSHPLRTLLLLAYFIVTLISLLTSLPLIFSPSFPLFVPSHSSPSSLSPTLSPHSPPLQTLPSFPSFPFSFHLPPLIPSLFPISPPFLIPVYSYPSPLSSLHSYFIPPLLIAFLRYPSRPSHLPPLLYLPSFPPASPPSHFLLCSFLFPRQSSFLHFPPLSIPLFSLSLLTSLLLSFPLSLSPFLTSLLLFSPSFASLSLLTSSSISPSFPSLSFSHSSPSLSPPFSSLPSHSSPLISPLFPLSLSTPLSPLPTFPLSLSPFLLLSSPQPSLPPMHTRTHVSNCIHILIPHPRKSLLPATSSNRRGGISGRQNLIGRVS
ncbi:hypothetical protein C7M84_022960 [Penaeus vannamei]|uniref:Uncharacterized protein n=1 Tax=Penaeus vannamei TaxID=6689 RepID=A0A3R7NCV2_PENVA|nr:hypothetical protein C7M84_022960 [Penaeus vannamei]